MFYDRESKALVKRSQVGDVFSLMNDALPEVRKCDSKQELARWFGMFWIACRNFMDSQLMRSVR